MFASPRNSTPSSSPMKKAKSKPAKPYAAKPSTKKIGTYTAKTQATSDLQAEIAVLALGAAEKVVANNLDSATQTELIENYIQKVGAGS